MKSNLSNDMILDELFVYRTDTNLEEKYNCLFIGVFMGYVFKIKKWRRFHKFLHNIDRNDRIKSDMLIVLNFSEIDKLETLKLVGTYRFRYLKSIDRFYTFIRNRKRIYFIIIKTKPLFLAVFKQDKLNKRLRHYNYLQTRVNKPTELEVNPLDALDRRRRLTEKLINFFNK